MASASSIAASFCEAVRRLGDLVEADHEFDMRLRFALARRRQRVVHHQALLIGVEGAGNVAHVEARIADPLEADRCVVLPIGVRLVARRNFLANVEVLLVSGERALGIAVLGFGVAYHF